MCLQAMPKVQIAQILTMSKSDQSGAWVWTWLQTSFISTAPRAFKVFQQYKPVSVHLWMFQTDSVDQEQRFPVVKDLEGATGHLWECV